MKQITVSAPAHIQTRIKLPSSKSICNRALIINALSQGNAPIDNLSDCDDTRVMVQALQAMPETIDIGAAGTAMRFLTAYLTVREGETHILTGTQRMKQRPIGILVNALRELGADISYLENEGFPPLLIRGKALTGSAISLPGNVSSQYISALLMIGPMLKNGLEITLEKEVISRPYIDMTLKLMNQFGADACWRSPQTLGVSPQPYSHHPFYVESDWSAASYWYEICALTPDAVIELPALFAESLQGDSAIASLFSHLGVSTEYHPDKVILKNQGNAATTLEYNFINQPDLAQTLVVTCALLQIPFRFSGLQSLKIKETDRIHALITEMKKLGFLLKETENGVLAWEGERCPAELASGIDTYEDHRMAMAFAPACICIQPLRINEPQVVSKSYPHFWEDLRTAGFNITE